MAIDGVIAAGVVGGGGVADADVDNWHRLIRQYDCTPVSHDFMLDYKRYKGRPMPFDEQVASVRKDIDFGARLGIEAHIAGHPAAAGQKCLWIGEAFDLLRREAVLAKGELRADRVTNATAGEAGPIGGAVLTETIFSWPGVGKWLIESINRRDYPALQGGIMLIATIVILVNLFIDMLYGLINPRIRHAK